MRRILDGLLAAAARAALHVFFRRVEVEGAERLPGSGPLLVVANHVNALIDPVLLLGLAARLRPRFLGKSTLWRIWPLRPFLAWAGAVPVHRRKDPGVDPARNLETFARCHELLRRGGTIALFPEGVSHDQPALQPLKTGAARIALEAEARFGPLGVLIAPVGIVFEEKAAFRSRVLLNVGAALDPEPQIAAATADPAGAARELTARIDTALRELTLNYDSWREARLLERGAALLAAAQDLPGAPSLAAEFERRRAALGGYRELARRLPEPTAAAIPAVQSYDRLLRAFSLRDEQVRARYPLLPVGRYLLRALALLLLRLPLALVGTLLNVLPYQLVRAVAWTARASVNLQATVKLFSALVVYPTCWGLLAWVALRWPQLPGWAPLALLLAAPATGWVALRFHEEQATLVQEARAFLLLRTRRRLAQELRSRRARAAQAVATLAAELEEKTGTGTHS